MNSLKVPESGLLLDGSSGGDSSLPPQAFVLSLNDDVIADMIQSARNGDDLHVAFGGEPTLHYGTRSHQISPLPDGGTVDLYLTKPFESTRRAERLPQTGSLFQRPKPPLLMQKKKPIQTVKEADPQPKPTSSSSKASASSGLDSDIEALQNGLAAHDAARDRAHLVAKVPSKNASAKVKNKLWAGYNASPTSMPTSPALPTARSPSSTPVLSASQQVMERKKEQRVVLVHELAVKDRTAEYLREKWTGKDAEFSSTLEKMAEFLPETKKWAMKKSCWKELDVWKYDYTSRDARQTAIDNAIRQYDKQRLSSSEVEWQRLLPKEERGKGKCLSRLQANLAKGPAQPASKAKAQKADDSSGSKDDGDSDKANAGGESMSRSSSNPLPKPKKPSAQDAQAKRLLGNSKAKAAVQKPSTTKAKAGGKATGARVLSAAIIENSDSSGDEALMDKAKAKSNPEAKAKAKAKAAPAPAPAPVPVQPKDTVVVNTKQLNLAPPAKQPRQQQPTKRPREDDDSSSSSGTPLSKRIKAKQPLPVSVSKPRKSNVGPPSRNAGTSSSFKTTKNTSPTKSSPLASSPPTNASELDESTPPAPKKRKAEGEGKPAGVKRRMVETVPTDVMTKASKFKAYYQKYEALHYEISALDEPPTEKLANLLDMRGRLQMMKKEIYKQCSPDRE
ncbi:COM1 regulatory protein [Tolypocladium capitatum]|uniref:COM1 regulatory protein n=1 Tax=Tolypocladium capitatum TaxID=45235 RepID=A0A2K3QBU7_9HYPO|nr:COM1 regulatory protein [Tolypocladium capitatum]